MNWHDRDFFDFHYFEDVIEALKAHRFLQTDSHLSKTQQVGEWVVDRVDRVLDAAADAPSGMLAEKAIRAFEICTEQFPDEVTAYLRTVSGNRGFSGLFNTANLDAYVMWCHIAKRTTSNWHAETSWLHKLAHALIRDSELGGKIGEAAECCRLGLSRGETLNQIEDHHRALGSHNTSAKSLLLLELI